MAYSISNKAAFPDAGWTKLPPVKKVEVEKTLERELPDQCWAEIVEAFRLYGLRRDALSVSRLSKKKDAKDGWYARRSESQASLSKALANVNKCLGKQKDFLTESSENYSLQDSGGLETFDLQKDLKQASDLINRVLSVVERVEPIKNETPTDASSRIMLTQHIKKAFDRAGVEVRISDGRDLGEEASEKELTKFEQVLSLLEVHSSDRPSAFSKWARSALKGEKWG